MGYTLKYRLAMAGIGPVEKTESRALILLNISAQ